MTSTGESGETGALVHCWWQCKMAQPRGKTVWQMHKKLNHHMIAAVPVLGVYPKELKAETQTCLYTGVHSNVIYNDQKVETFWINRTW